MKETLSHIFTVTLSTSFARGRQMPGRDHHHRPHIHALKLVRDLGRRKLRAAKPVGSVSVPCSSVLARDFTHISVEIKRCASEYRPGAVRQGCLCGSCCGKAIERDGRRSLGQLAMRSHRRPGFHVMNVRGESHHTASLSNAYNTLPKKNLHTNRAKAFPPSSCLPRKTQPR